MAQRGRIWIIAVLLIGGCTAYTGVKLEQRYGAPAPRDRIVDVVPAGEPDYWSDVKHIVEQRCVVCHGCYDAPCQLNITSLFGEKQFRKPDEDTISVVPGFIGSYPNALLVVNDYDIERFVDMISSLRTEGDYARLLDNFGVRRTSPNFWQHSDAIHAAYRLNAPVEHGRFDYNRLENR